MAENGKGRLSTEPYKGVRDFYPEDMFVQNYIFAVWKKSAESFGYGEYGASVLEPAELYRAKSGEEIVNEQTYTFTDRGEREVTLRPEMTPTVARMVAAKRQILSLPVRWYSIPNLFRYERPQKGRLREHWQLNVDLFGVESTDAEFEVISLANDVMRRFGADAADYEIRINSRKTLDAVYKNYELSEDASHALSKLIDKKEKMGEDEFKSGVSEILGSRAEGFLALLEQQADLPVLITGDEGYLEATALIAKLNEAGIGNVRFDLTLMRGFDYYTGIVFEIFDTNPENRRSMFGGGRYDRLLEIFGVEPVPTVGFGMGDVTLREFLDSRGLLPPYMSPADVALCHADEDSKAYAVSLAAELRAKGVNVSTDISSKKLGDQIKKAEKESIPFVIVVGENERSTGAFKAKDMATREETALQREEIADFILRRMQ